MIPHVEDGNVDRMNLILKPFLRYVLVKQKCSRKLQKFVCDPQYHWHEESGGGGTAMEAVAKWETRHREDETITEGKVQKSHIKIE